MKLWKRLTVIVMAVALVMSLGITAFANGTDTTIDIEISGAVNGATYKAYRLLNSTVNLKVQTCHDTEAEHTSACYIIGYTKNDTYWKILTDLTQKSTEIEVYEYIQSQNTAELIYQFAEDVYARVKGMDADDEVEAKADGTVILDNVTGGYWLIVETTPNGYTGTHSLLLLDTVGRRDIKVHTKRDTLTLEKKVQDNGTAYGMLADHQIGEDANFWILSDVPDYSEGFSNYVYTIHDVMESGLTFNPNSLEIRLNKIDGDILNPQYYTVNTAPNCKSGCTFHIDVKIKDALGANALKIQDRLYILYTAKLNQNAEVFKDGDITKANENKAWLEYSSDPHNEEARATTVPSSAYVWTFRMDLIKEDHEGVQLEEAKFVLSLKGNLTESDLNKINFTNPDPKLLADYKLIPLVSKETNHYHISDGSEGTVVYAFDAGKTSIGGFDDQTDYYIYEIKAPNGYNKLNAPTLFKFTVNYAAVPTETVHFAEGYPQITVGNNPASSVLEAHIVNQIGAELPSTGGIGTTIFYVLGGIMVLGAAVLLITKKRMVADV